MAKTFEVGDKVRLLDNSSPRFRCNGIPSGAIGRIIDVDGTSTGACYFIEFENVEKPRFSTAEGCAAGADLLELVADTPRKFAVGDKVRLTAKGEGLGEAHFYAGYVKEGDVGFIVSIDTGGMAGVRVGRPLRVRWNLAADVPETWYVPIDAVELVEDKPKFAVGGKVRVVTDKYLGSTHKFVGQVGVVEGIAQIGDAVQYDVYFEPGNVAESMYYDDDELEAYVEPTPEPKLTTKTKFNVGDKVRVLPSVSYYIAEASEGAEGVVEETDNERFDARPIRVRLTKVSENGAGAFVGATYHYAPGDLELIAPTSTLPLGFVPSPDHAHIDNATIERWVEDGVKNVEAQKTLGYDHPHFLAESGDALLVVENGEARLYRLEATKDVE